MVEQPLQTLQATCNVSASPWIQAKLPLFNTESLILPMLVCFLHRATPPPASHFVMHLALLLLLSSICLIGIAH